MIAMGKVVNLVLAIVACGFVNGQVPMAQVSSGDKNKGLFVQFVDEADSQLSVVLQKGNKYCLQKYNTESLILDEDWELGKLEYEGEVLDFGVATKSRRGYHLIFEALNESRETAYIVEQFVSNDGEVGRLRLLAEVSPVKVSTNIQYLFSEDSSKVVVYVPPVSEKDPKIYVYDKKWEAEYERVIEVPVKFEKLKLTDLQVTNDGDILVVAYEPLGRERKWDLDPARRYVITKISNDQRTRVYETPVTDKVFHFLTVRPDIKENIIVSATYSDGLEGEVYGVQYMELDAQTMDLKVEKSFSMLDVKSDINEDLKGQFFLGIVRQKSGLKGFKFTDFERYPNGNIVAVGERDFVDDPGNRVFGEILVMCFDPRGDLVWINVVDKIQNAQGVSKIHSYGFQQRGSAIYLFYNDDLANAERINKGESAKRATSYGKKFGLIAVRISQRGEMTLEAISSRNDTKGIVLPKSLFRADSQSILLSAGGYLMAPFVPVRLKY